MAYPTDLDTFTTHNTGDVIEASYDNAQQVAISALEAKVGIDGSAVTTSHDYKLSGVTGSDKAVSLTGSETLTNKTLTSPTITSPILTVGSDATGDIYYNSGSGVLARLGKGNDNQILKMNGSSLNWEDETVIANATTTTAGITELATSAEVTAGTATGGSGASIVVTPDALAASTPVFDGSGLTNVGRFSVNADETLNTWQTVEVAMYPTSTTAVLGWTLASTTVTTQSAGGYILLTPTISANFEMSTSLMGSGSTANYSPAQNKDIRIKFRLKVNDTSDRKGWGLCVTPANIHTAQTDTTNGEIRFILNGSTLYAQNANGTATSTDVSSGITVTNWNIYEIVFNPGTDIKYYINGTLVATHTTNLPTTGTLVLAYGVNANGRTIDTTFPVVSYEV